MNDPVINRIDKYIVAYIYYHHLLEDSGILSFCGILIVLHIDFG